MKKAVLVMVAACGPAATAPAKNHTVISYGGGASPGASSENIDATPPPPPPPPCIPATAELALGRVGDDLVACTRDAATCWDVDDKTGELGEHEPMRLPGYGYRDGDTLVATSADGRVVKVSATEMVVFSDKGQTLSQRALRDPKGKAAAKELAGAPVMAWFVGETVYVAGDDAVWVYPIDKPAELPIRGLRGGGVGVSDGVLAVHETALSRLTVADGKTKRVTKGRARHDEVCVPPESYAIGSEPSETDACGAHLKDKYRPYLGATIIADGTGFIGFDPKTRAMFVLDEHLAETARMPLATCQ